MFQINVFYLANSLNAMAEQMVGRCVTITGKWLHNCFTYSQDSLLLYSYFSECLFFLSVHFVFTYWHFYSWFTIMASIFHKGRVIYIYTLNTMIVIYPCLVCNRAVAENHKAVQCDCCDRWFHIEPSNHSS